MKKGKLLNSEISYEVAKIGHTQHITVCDAGLPIPEGVKRIDLAITKGYPSFLKVLETVISEMVIEEIVIAKEIKEKNEEMYLKIQKLFEKNRLNPKVIEVSHDKFKEITKESRAIIRTGECTPYSNIILKSGVAF